MRAPWSSEYGQIYINTFTGKFHPFDPSPDEVNIYDIAVALSLMVRWGGHTGTFYSVAQHSVIVSKCVNPEFALWGLLHDAAECYFGDVLGPVKAKLWEVDILELPIQVAIADKFNLCHIIPKEVKLADEGVANMEALKLFKNKPDWVGEPIGEEYFDKPWSYHRARSEFLTRFHQLEIHKILYL